MQKEEEEEEEEAEEEEDVMRSARVGGDLDQTKQIGTRYADNPCRLWRRERNRQTGRERERDSRGQDRQAERLKTGGNWPLG